MPTKSFARSTTTMRRGVSTFFVRPDGSYGFEEHRRDVEDGGAWKFEFGFGLRVFVSISEAEAAAKRSVGWLKF